MNITAIIVAAGNSSRMKSEKSKLLLDLNKKTVIRRTLETFENCSVITNIVVVIRESDRDLISEECKGITKIKKIVAGGKDRQDSVLNGVFAIEKSDFLAIHDGARPLVNISDIEKVCEMAKIHHASSLAVKVKDTIKETDSQNFVVNTPNRDNLWQVQTPQVFNYDMYLKAVEIAKSQKKIFTDDCQLFENAGYKVHLCEGDYHNIKITTPEDIGIAKSFETENFSMIRIGHGYDVHKLVPDRKLILGGVLIPHITGLLGHSDADVLLHAISDAILGACAMGDIGGMFPDTSEKFKDADSQELLSQVVERIKKAGYIIGNIDATIIAQAPKLSPHIQKMRENIAKVCETDINNINVKATTEEKLGFTGNKEGISAHSVVLLQRK